MKLHYLKDGYNRGYRIRHDDWPNDRFDIISYERFKEFQKACMLLHIPMVDDEEYDDA